MKRLLLITLLALVAMAGTASATLTHDASIWNEAGTNPAENPLVIYPGETLTLSYHATYLTPSAINNSATYGYKAGVVSGVGSASDLTVVFTHPNFTPTSAPTYTDVGVIKLTLDENAAVGTVYKVTIQVAGVDTESVFIYGQASRQVESIPEFPTIALPIAAILGLAFFMQRRKEE
ncbi:MAG: PEF-CTERM sorting domain-containing protein [Methanolobus sp.]|uniref:PEF-CTERM sorting domain-containing protein n=1 Tax=Methanolobus sp. TaxID=1874737 RepID=UPI00272F3E1B|nr:PEF-CTERM sorting domain-containing protein [Methanolobus sp.]MDP2217113.1 PEF-CTERM sorting domain-containing protein [Methanolobus sp.]